MLTKKNTPVVMKIFLTSECIVHDLSLPPTVEHDRLNLKCVMRFDTIRNNHNVEVKHVNHRFEDLTMEKKNIDSSQEPI